MTVSRKNWRKKKKQQPAQHPAPIRWEFGPDVPTHDFLDDGPLDNVWHLQEAVANFVWWVEQGKFLTWEAVVREEQGHPLTPSQAKAIGGLLNFNDEAGDEIHYIDEFPRPSEPWYVILNRIVPHLLIEPFRTFDVHREVQCEGWNQIMTALKDHGGELSLPPDTASYAEVVPLDTRHKLCLQSCFDALGGLGQVEKLTLQDPKHHYLIDEFIDHLREDKESVTHFGLTL